MQKLWVRDRRHTHPNDATSKFERWIREYGGPSKLAKSLELHECTVGAWIRRRMSPSLLTAKKILELSKGELTITDILDGTRAW